MEIVDFKRREMKQFIKEYTFNNGTVHLENGKKYKLDRAFVEDMKRRHDATLDHYGVDRNQIEWLSSKRNDVTLSTLPSGIITFEGIDVGVIYPRFFYDYDSFNNMSREDTLLILKNIRSAISKNEELLSNGIVNINFVTKDIMYCSDDVQLIDLDGSHIKREGYASYEGLYTRFVHDIYGIIDDKLKLQCRGKASEYSRLICEARDIFKYCEQYSKLLDYPRRVINEIEKQRILK